MIDPACVEHEILDSGVDDYTGLWEIVWWLNGQFPGASPDERLDAARRGVGELLRRGWIELYRGDRFAGDEPQDVATDIDAIFSDPAAWDAPRQEDKTHIRFAATDEGERAYFSTPRVESPAPTQQ